MNKKQQGMLSYFLIILGAIIISKMSGIKLSMCVLMVFLPFIVAGFVILGKKFTIKAALGSVVYMLGLEFFELPILKDIISEHSGSFSTVSTIDEILR